VANQDLDFAVPTMCSIRIFISMHDYFLLRGSPNLKIIMTWKKLYRWNRVREWKRYVIGIELISFFTVLHLTLNAVVGHDCGSQPLKSPAKKDLLKSVTSHLHVVFCFIDLATILLSLWVQLEVRAPYHKQLSLRFTIEMLSTCHTWAQHRSLN
jgi:hypothetical protein